MKTVLFPFAAALALAACSSSKVDFQIDNPTAAPLSITLDGKTLQVPAQQAQPVTLAAGEHHLRSERLGDVRFIVYADTRGGLINPTLSEYVTANAIYLTGPDKAKNFGSINARIELNGVTFEGPFKQTHDLFIDKDWTFGVREPFPDEQVVAHVDASGGKIDRKIFTAPDFIAYVETGMGQPGAFERARPGRYVTPRFALEKAPATLPPLDPAYEAHAGALRALYARHLRATSADAQRALRKEAFQAQMAFTTATATLGASLPPSANEAYNTFVHAFGELTGRSALVVP
ncbi:hypothetical protein [Xanthomonas sacchari]|uniref:hypothetical protein n=1 Tax=Xanthomonas sacchari TaxID=56458 RepID=UPI0022552748|nr:hypothetical protein [Xanthomonas sacchari]MCW0402600.1 hypothetical protein [Xanthomonas sacchari]